MDLPMAATYSFVYLLIQSLKIIFIEYLPCDRHMDKSHEMIKWMDWFLQSQT